MNRSHLSVPASFHRRRALRAVVVVLAVVAGCGLNVFPVSKDVELGKQVDTEIRSNPKEYPILQGRDDIKSYVRGVAAAVLQSPEIKYRGTFAYTVEIIHDDKTVNAFCTPGGYIYVYTGLLKFVDNEATLAGVLAHEIGHAEKRHSTAHMTAQLGVQEATAIALGEHPSQLATIGANLFTGMALLKYSRSEEAEADDCSFGYLHSSKVYYPGAIKFFFEKMQRQQGSSGAAASTLTRYLSDHPMNEDRLAAIESQMKRNNIGAPQESSLRSAPYKAMLAKLP